MTKSVDEDKIVITIDLVFAYKSGLFLICLLHTECFFNSLSHYNFTVAVYGLGSIDREVDPFVVFMIEIDQCVVYIDKASFEIDVLPAKTGKLSDTQSCIHHNEEGRIPVMVSFILIYEPEEVDLLSHRQSLLFLALQIAAG